MPNICDVTHIELYDDRGRKCCAEGMSSSAGVCNPPGWDFNLGRVVDCIPPTYDQWGTLTSYGTCGGVQPSIIITPKAAKMDVAEEYVWVEPSVPAIPDLPKQALPLVATADLTCPKGKSYDAGSVIAVTRDCGTGYTAVGGLLNTKCVCTKLSQEAFFGESPKEVQEFYKTPEEQVKGPSIIPDLTSPEWFGDMGNIMKMLPTLLMFAVVIAVLGLFRK